MKKLMYLFIAIFWSASIWGQSQTITFEYEDGANQYSGKIKADLILTKDPKEFIVKFKVTWVDNKPDRLIYIFRSHITGANDFKIEAMKGVNYAPFNDKILIKQGYQIRFLAKKDIPLNIKINFALPVSSGKSTTSRQLYTEGKSDSPCFQFSTTKNDKITKDEINYINPAKKNSDGKIIFKTKNTEHTYFIIIPYDDKGNPKGKSGDGRAIKTQKMEIPVSPGRYLARIAYPSSGRDDIKSERYITIKEFGKTNSETKQTNTQNNRQKLVSIKIKPDSILPIIKYQGQNKIFKKGKIIFKVIGGKGGYGCVLKKPFSKVLQPQGDKKNTFVLDSITLEGKYIFYMTGTNAKPVLDTFKIPIIHDTAYKPLTFKVSQDNKVIKVETFNGYKNKIKVHIDITGTSKSLQADNPKTGIYTANLSQYDVNTKVRVRITDGVVPHFEEVLLTKLSNSSTGGGTLLWILTGAIILLVVIAIWFKLIIPLLTKRKAYKEVDQERLKTRQDDAELENPLRQTENLPQNEIKISHRDKEKKVGEVVKLAPPEKLLTLAQLDEKKQYTYALATVWEDSRVANVYFNREAASDIGTFVDSSLRYEPAPEVGGYLLGKYLEISKGVYEVTIEHFVKDEESDQGVYELNFSTEAMVQLDDTRELVNQGLALMELNSIQKQLAQLAKQTDNQSLARNLDRLHSDFANQLKYAINLVKALHKYSRQTQHTNLANKARTILQELRHRKQNVVIVGWLHTHPQHTPFLSQPDLNIHNGFFQKDYQIAVVIDPLSENDHMDTGVFTRKTNGLMNNKQDKKEWLHWTDIKEWLKTTSKR